LKLDILAFAAHPDDTELACSGTLASHIDQGYKVGVVDLTRGELGTRGTVKLRDVEAQDSAKFLGLAARDNLNLADGYFQDDAESQKKVAAAIRYYQPKIILANAINDRHPDHGKAARLVDNAWFMAGLEKVKLSYKGELQPIWKASAVYHYIQSWYVQPDFVVDISDYWDKKIAAIKQFKSQFYDPDNNEPETYISSEGFLKALESRANEFGHSIGVRYAEGFTASRNIGVKDLSNLL
jgi:bacillithiol biosynthesis deacetylase BshB1